MFDGSWRLLLRVNRLTPSTCWRWTYSLNRILMDGRVTLSEPIKPFFRTPTRSRRSPSMVAVAMKSVYTNNAGASAQPSAKTLKVRPSRRIAYRSSGSISTDTSTSRALEKTLSDGSSVRSLDWATRPHEETIAAPRSSTSAPRTMPLTPPPSIDGARRVMVSSCLMAAAGPPAQSSS